MDLYLLVNKCSSVQIFKTLRFYACPQGGDDEEKCGRCADQIRDFPYRRKPAQVADVHHLRGEKYLKCT